MKTVQYFTPDYLENCSKMKPEQILKYLEDYKTIYYQSKPIKTKLISIKIPEDLLGAFRAKSDLNGVKYQTQIKNLMNEWVALRQEETRGKEGI